MLKALETIAVSLCVFCSFAINGHAGETWKLASLDWQPYAGKDMPNQGTAVEALRAVLQPVGIELDVEFFPWARAQEFAHTEGYVGYFPAWPEEVMEGFSASDAVAFSQIAVMTYTGSGVEWKGLETLFAEQSVGLVRTYVYPEPIRALRMQWPEHVLLLPTEESLLKKLSRQHMTTAITDPHVMLYLAEAFNIDNVMLLKDIGSKPLVVAFRATTENLKKMELLNELLRFGRVPEIE